MGVYTESWQELERNFGGRSVLKGSVEEIRGQFDGLIAALAPEMPPPSAAVSTQDGEVNGVKYRIYTPLAAAATGKLPVGVYTHGGGWIVGDLETEDLLCRAVSEHGPSIIVSVDYRLAPEHKCPTQLQDALSVFKWARQNAETYGGDPTKFYTIGGSAGGGLALGVANQIVRDSSNRDAVKGVVAMVPTSLHPDNVPEEYRSMYSAYEDNKDNVPVIDQTSMRQFFEYTEVNPSDKSYFVALDKDNHKNFPPTYIVTCEFDPLRDDGMVMAHALKKAGVPVKTDHYKGLPHYFWIFPSVPEGQRFVGNLIAGVKWVINRM